MNISIISRILKNKEDILSTIEKGRTGRSRTTDGKFDQLEQELAKWINIQRCLYVPINGPLVQVFLIVDLRLNMNTDESNGDCPGYSNSRLQPK